MSHWRLQSRHSSRKSCCSGRARGSAFRRRASLARDHVEQNLERDVALASLAKIACLSPFHLHRVFKAAFGETPAAMRRRRRIEQARGLLARTRRPVAEIARAVGFESESAFSRSFRALSGASPTAFRNAAGP